MTQEEKCCGNCKFWESTIDASYIGDCIKLTTYTFAVNTLVTDMIFYCAFWENKHE